MKNRGTMSVDLTSYSEIDLIKACIEKGITPNDYMSAYTHMQESYYALQDDIYGSSEAGLHGANTTR
jgi:hypothetical protein